MNEDLKRLFAYIMFWTFVVVTVALMVVAVTERACGQTPTPTPSICCCFNNVCGPWHTGQACAPPLVLKACPPASPTRTPTPGPSPTRTPTPTPTPTPAGPLCCCAATGPCTLPWTGGSCIFGTIRTCTTAGTPTPTPTPTTPPAPGVLYTEVRLRAAAWDYVQAPTGVCESGGPCAIVFDYGVLPYPDTSGASYEALGLAIYPRGGVPSFLELLKGTHANNTHECPYPTMILDRSNYRIVHARTTYSTIGICANNRIRGGLIQLGALSETAQPEVKGDWLYPWNVELGDRCSGAGRLGNVGWTNALVRIGSGVYLYTRDDTVPGGPWVRYIVSPDWRSVVLDGAVTFPAGWVDDVGTTTSGKLVALLTPPEVKHCETGTEIVEAESSDGGRTFALNGHKWFAPIGRRVCEAGYIHRATDGQVWPDAVLVTSGNGAGAANGEGDWKIYAISSPTTTAPISDFNKPLTFAP
jgi:hypothetical protein